MKTSKRSLMLQRQLMEKKTQNWLKMSDDQPPPSGWVKAIRGSLGITTRQLASLMGVTQGAVMALEEREVKGTTTLESVRKAASAMNCKMIYAIVPDDPFSSLEEIISARAEHLVQRFLKKVDHTMSLEKQGTKSSESERKKLIDELMKAMDSRIWDTEKN